MKRILLPRVLFLSLLLLGGAAARAAVGDMTTLSIAAGVSHGLALRSDGSVWYWGTNESLSTLPASTFPVRVSGLGNISAIGAGDGHSLVVSNGTVLAWGRNESGELGNGTTTASTVPVSVIGITNAIAVAGGGFHSLALLANGQVMAWGYNGYGGLGNGTLNSTNKPVLVSTLTNVTAICAGEYNSMALTASGQVWCWGYGGFGTIGNGTFTTAETPVQALNVSNIIGIAEGAYHNLALKSDGTLWVWGYNADGELGLGNTNNTDAPAQLSAISQVQTIGAGGLSSVACLTSGQTMQWGYQNGATLLPAAVAQAPAFQKLVCGNEFNLGMTSAGVWAWGINTYGQFGNGNMENPAIANFVAAPALSFNSTPIPQWGEFVRGDPDELNFCTIVVPEELEQGTALNNSGTDAYCFSNSVPWFLSVQKQTLYQPSYFTTGTNVWRSPVDNAVVAFGGAGNGSPLFVNQPYSFGVYAGGLDENPSTTGATNVIRISVYSASSFTPGVTNIAPLNVYTIPLPRRTVSADSNAWTSFMTNGASTTFTSNGLTTTVSFLDNGDPNNKPFGLYWLNGSSGQPAVITNFDLTAYTLTHTATSTNYYYRIEVLGKVQVATNALAYMMTNSSGVWTSAPLYTLDFTQPNPLQSMYVNRLFFQGTPMPPTYENATAPGPTGLTTLVTNVVSLSSSVYTNLDGSPELRRSPILDQFVTNMNKDPLALASYVINQIALTDPYADAQANQVIAAQINCGGIDRSAQATFLEGQGSPVEQCALLVYLLRSAGYPAAYVFPTNGNLLMSDTHISQLWRMQVSGVEDILGIPYVTNSLLTVDYPWVVANIGTNTVHIFPWIKDTKIVQGVNLYDYMPTNYNSALAWTEQYVRANPTIMGLNSENLPAVLFPAFVQQRISTNVEGASISLNDLGVTAYDRPHQFPTWSYLTQPDAVTNLNSLAIVDSLTDSAVTYPFLSNIFNTSEIKVYNVTGATSNQIMDTMVWDACDFHDRKLLLFTNNSQICLWMAPYRTNITTVTTFTNGAPSSTSIQSNYWPASGITNLAVDVIHKRRVAYLSQPANNFPVTESLGTTNVSKCFTYEVAGISLDFGRVTPAMLQPYEDFYWGLQRQRAANTSFVPPVQDYQGTAAYLLAMGYWQKYDAFDALNQQWHSVRGLLDFRSGLGVVGNPGETNMQARVDMLTTGEAIIANGSLRPDSGTPDFSSLQNYNTLSIVDGSAQEHDILQTMFPDQNAVSTVRLLQLAQLRATNGNSPILELVNNNYIAQGNATHSGYGATALKNISPTVWGFITNVFNEVDGAYARALVTPGLVTNGSASFGGMGALTFSYQTLGALISSNSVVFNGGAGSVLNSFTPVGSSDTLPFSLTANPDGSISFSYNNPSGGNVDPALSPLDSAGLSQENVTPTTSQNNEAVAVANVNGQAPPANQQTTLYDLLVAANDGFDGTAVAWQQSSGEAVDDPVDPVSGGFYVDAVDLSLPGPFPLQLRRNYLSQNPSANNFGYGWKMNFMPYLVLTTNASSQSVIYAADMNGVVVAYHQTNVSNPWVVLPADNPSLNNNSSVGKGGIANLFNSVLHFYSTNGGTYIISAPDGSTRTYTEMSFAIVNGTNTMNRTRPYLTQWTDHSGNYAQVVYDMISTDDGYGQPSRINMANGNDLVFTYDFYGRIIQAFTGDGRFVTYQYDNYGDLVNVTLPDNTQCQYQYQHYNFVSTNGSVVTTNIDSTHLMVQEIKPNGRIVANNYDSLNRVTNQMSTVGTNLVLVTNAYFFYTNNVTTLTNQFATGSTGVQDFFHNTTVYYYSSNQVTNVLDPYGYSTKQVWYADNATAPGYPRSLQYTVDKRGLTNSYYYNGSGCVTQMVTSGNITGEGVSNQSATNTYTYTAQNLPSAMTDAVGNGMQFVYDSGDAFKLDQSIRVSGGTAVYTNLNFYTNVSSLSTIGTTNYAYGMIWRQVQGGATNDFFYSGRGFKTEQIQYTATIQTPGDTDPSVITLYNYNERGQCYQQQVVGGALTQETFDAMGRTTSRQVYDQNNNNVNNEFWYYNDNGELQWYVGPRINPVQYVYYVYDGAGRTIQQINWRSQGMADGAGVEAPDGNNLYATTFKTFDGFGNNTSITDPRGGVTTNQFDALGRVLQTQVNDVNGSTLTTQKFAYEPGGKVTKMTNALGGVGTTLYTQTGQPYAQTNPDGSTNGWTYYLDGRIKEEILHNGTYYLTTYDDVKQLVTKTVYAAGTTVSTNVAGFDWRGNQSLIVDAKGNPFTNSFDGLNRIKFYTGPNMVNILTNVPLPSGNSNQTNTFQAAYTNIYDAAGLAITNINILGETKIAYFDVLGRQTQQAFYNPSSSLARIIMTSYSPDHQSETITQGSGSTAIVKTIYTDNANKPVLTISYPSSGTEEFILDRYDAAENQISETHNTTSGGAASTWTTTSLVVDGLNRVTSKTDRDGAVTTYSYDAASDPTGFSISHGPSWTATYNSAQQMLYDFDSGSSSITRSNNYTYYSTLGLLNTKTDGRGVTCTYYYDSLLRPASNVYSGSLPEHNMIVSWAYDSRNFPTNIAESFASTNTGPNVTVSRTYGMYWELIQESITGGNNYSATEAYDADIRRTGLGINNVFGWGFTYQADGMMTSAGSSSLYGGASFTYSTSGLLTSSLFSPRTTSITQFDGDGRPLAATTTANGSTVLTESQTYTPDGLLATHTVARPDFTDNRSYTYANLSRRLTQETVGLSSSSNWTTAFAYDNGVSGGPGVLTSMGQATGTNVSWKGGTDAFSRVNAATNTVALRQAYGFLNGTATMTAQLDGNNMPVTLFGTNDNYRWQAQLSLTPGSHKLIVNALNWSGFYTASATNTFTNNSLDHVQEAYAGNGEVTNRVWISTGGKTNATESLTFDAIDRLHSVTYLDTNNNGYIWSAAYDALGRRMSTTTISVTNGVALTNLASIIGQYYDPNVSFLELGASYNGSMVWKFYGPDVTGTYGEMQGLGGLQAVVNGPRESSPMIYDTGGNELGIYVVSNSTVSMFPSRVTAYGAVPDYAPLPVADGAKIGQSSAWRGKWPDITGFYYDGRRYYDPVAGSFLTADPLGHSADPSLYAFCALGDPVNYFDPDGRMSAPTVNAQIPTASDSGSYAQNLAQQLGINYIPQLPGESMADYSSRLGLSGGMASSPWAIAQASGSYALFSGIMNSGGVPDPSYQETPWGGQWLVNAVVNSDAISEAYNEFTHPDFSSGIGVVTFGVAGVSLGANVLTAAGNVLTLGELGAAENGIKTGVKEIAEGTFPRNFGLAGTTHPVTGIPFNANGFPNFSSVARETVQIEYTGTRVGDYEAANLAAGLEETPEGYTWHHVEDGRTMQLVPTEIHSATGHTGGFSLYPQR